MGLIVPRNLFAYPGGNPGFNPSHFAAPGLRYSGVATNGGKFSNLLTGAPSVLTNGTLSSGILGGMGSAVVSNTATVYNAVANSFSDTPTALSFACIGSLIANNTTEIIFCTKGTSIAGASGLYRASVNGLSAFFNGAGLASATVGSLAVGVPFFYGVSARNGAQNSVLARLDTGQIISAASSAAITLTIGTAAWGVGGVATTGQQAAHNLAALMYGVNNFLSMPQMLAWAAAPWDFWYPPTQLLTTLSAPPAPPPAIGLAPQSLVLM